MGRKTGKRYTEEQIIRILDELKRGKTVEEVCRNYNVAQSTLYRWKKPVKYPKSEDSCLKSCGRHKRQEAS